MEVLKFRLSGRTAFFKKPEVNTYYYFTYGNIHKVALLGMLGAIAGYGGYGQMKLGDAHPEFYEKLKDLKLSIAPDERLRGSFPKKIQSFNNSVGYASTEKGGNLIVKQQWLEGPSWDIYVQLNNEESKFLADQLLSRKSVFIPYLGSNAHPADIDSVELLSAEPVSDLEEERIHSLFPAGLITLDYEEEIGKPYQYEEYLPVGLQENTNLYHTEKFYFTNLVIGDANSKIYQLGEKNIVFF